MGKRRTDKVSEGGMMLLHIRYLFIIDPYQGFLH